MASCGRQSRPHYEMLIAHTEHFLQHSSSSSSSLNTEQALSISFNDVISCTVLVWQHIRSLVYVFLSNCLYIYIYTYVLFSSSRLFLLASRDSYLRHMLPCNMNDWSGTCGFTVCPEHTQFSSRRPLFSFPSRSRTGSPPHVPDENRPRSRLNLRPCVFSSSIYNPSLEGLCTETPGGRVDCYWQ